MKTDVTYLIIDAISTENSGSFDAQIPVGNYNINIDYTVQRTEGSINYNSQHPIIVDTKIEFELEHWDVTDENGDEVYDKFEVYTKAIENYFNS